jgi:hypothetical protein
MYSAANLAALSRGLGRYILAVMSVGRPRSRSGSYGRLTTVYSGIRRDHAWYHPRRREVRPVPLYIRDR